MWIQCYHHEMLDMNKHIFLSVMQLLHRLDEVEELNHYISLVISVTLNGLFWGELLRAQYYWKMAIICCIWGWFQWPDKPVMQYFWWKNNSGEISHAAFCN